MSSCYRRVNFYDLCRLCAQSIQDNKIKIFEPKGQEIQLQSKIEKCLSININEDDFLPKVICPRCIDQLEICNAFREECLKSEKMLSSYFKNYRHTEDFKKSGKVYIKDTARTEILNDTSHSLNNKLDLLSSKLLKNGQLKKYEVCMKNVHSIISNSSQNNPNKKIKVEELLCNSIISPSQAKQIPYTIDFLNEALKKAVQQLPKEILSKVVVNTNGEIINLTEPEIITIDPKISANVILGVNSVIKNKGAKMRSPEKQAKETNDLGQGIVKIDLTGDDRAKQTSLIKDNLKPSAKYCQSNEQSTAQNPSVIFPVPHQNNNHTSVQSSNISYPQKTKVNISPSTPNIIGGTNNIEHTDTTPTKLSPPSSINMDDLRSNSYISMSVQQKGNITEDKKDVKNGDPLKPYLCEVCSKSFKRREHLKQHCKLHSSLRPYRCVECNKSFVRKEHLMRHMVLHSGERNFICEICKKSFSRHDNLLKHIRTHKEPTYTCDVCQKIFVFKHYLDIHRSEQGKCFLSSQVRAC